MRNWTLAEKIELAIGKFADSYRRGQPRETSVHQIVSLVPSAQDIDATDALLRLYSKGSISLDKWVQDQNAHIPFAQFSSPSSLFYGPPYGDFRVGVTASGRLDFEKREIQEPIVFISCGQWHPHEKALGQKLLLAVGEHPPLRGYFAEYQSSLSNLSRHIFEALDRCIALVAVMHNRGNVTTPAGQITRASVWIEQEIAIASFLTERLGRNIEIASYIEKGICLEGIRSQLILNPVEFTTDDEILDHLHFLLQQWKTLVI